METATLPAPKGRPREFCTEQALAAALGVFWRKGFEAASLTDLTEAMGITKPSLYAAFGNKEALFRKALDLYEREKLAYVGKALAAPTAREVVERLLYGALALQSSSGDPRCCMGVISSVSCSEQADSIKADITARRVSSERALAARLDRAKADGDLGAGADPLSLARYVSAIMQGMGVQASAGATQAELTALVETSLAMWPSR